MVTVVSSLPDLGVFWIVNCVSFYLVFVEFNVALGFIVLFPCVKGGLVVVLVDGVFVEPVDPEEPDEPVEPDDPDEPVVGVVLPPGVKTTAEVGSVDGAFKEVSSICTENSMPRVIIKYLHIMSPPDNWQEPSPSVVLRCFTQIYMNRSPTADNEIVDSTNTKGKGIAFNVRGRGSTGKSAKTLQKGLRKLHNSSSEEGGCNNIQEQHEHHHQDRQQDQDKQSQQNSRILLSYLMLEQEILQNAGVRAREFMKRFNGSQGYQRIYEMVEETYKIILIPEQVLAKVVGVLSAEQKRVQALNAYERLRIAENRHPLARKAADKVKRFFE